MQLSGKSDAAKAAQKQRKSSEIEKDADKCQGIPLVIGTLASPSRTERRSKRDSRKSCIA
jgi:hypothetical protein